MRRRPDSRSDSSNKESLLNMADGDCLRREQRRESGQRTFPISPSRRGLGPLVQYGRRESNLLADLRQELSGFALLLFPLLCLVEAVFEPFPVVRRVVRDREASVSSLRMENVGSLFSSNECSCNRVGPIFRNESSRRTGHRVRQSPSDWGRRSGLFFDRSRDMGGELVLGRFEHERFDVPKRSRSLRPVREPGRQTRNGTLGLQDGATDPRLRNRGRLDGLHRKLRQFNLCAPREDRRRALAL